MRRRGSVSFVVEVKKRRFPQKIAAPGDLGRTGASPAAPAGATKFVATPFARSESISDPTIEAAKTAARQFFSSPGSPRSLGVAHWSDPGARGFVTVAAPARPAEVPVQTPSADPVAAAPTQPNGADRHRPGRILQSLIVTEDPIDALLRREAEERSARRRSRAPRARGTVQAGTEAAMPSLSRTNPANQMAVTPDAGLAAAIVSTDVAAPVRKARRRTTATEDKTAVATPTDRPVRRRKTKATKAPRRPRSLGRVAKPTVSRRLGTPGVAKRAAARKAAKKNIGRTAVVHKTTSRKRAAKAPMGRPAATKKRATTRRAVRSQSGRKVTSRKIATTNRSAAVTKKTGTGPRKPVTRRTRRGR